jgi:hypothetical protein
VVFIILIVAAQIIHVLSAYWYNTMPNGHLDDTEER